MRGREIGIALCCLMAGFVLAAALRVLATLPTPVVSYSLVIVAMGTALVVVRINRLGAFEGELGSPRHESMIRDLIGNETERSVRYGREFTVVLIHQPRATVEDWRRYTRGSDAIIRCNRGLVLLILPETGSEGAMFLLRRLPMPAVSSVQAALVSCPDDGRNAQTLCTTLLTLVREGTAPGQVRVREGEFSRTIPLVA